MAINFNDNLRILKGQPIDNRYFATNGQPYVSIDAVNLQIPLTYRYIGLTVNINKVEYWYANNLYDLTLKGGTGTITIDPSITLAGTNYGSYQDGDIIASGTTIQEVFENMFRVSVPPTYTAPTVNITNVNSTLEVGTYVDYTINTVFTQNDAGINTNYLLNKAYSGDTYILYNGLPIVDVVDGSTDPLLLGSDLVYTAIVTYAEGVIKNDNMGNPIPTGHILSGTTSDTFTVIGARKLFYDDTTDTTTPTTSANIRSLSNSMLAPINGTTFTINITTGTTRIVFAYPSTLQNVSSVKYVELGNGEVKDTFSLSTISVEGLNGYTATDYKVYTYLPAVPFGDNATYNVTI